MADFIIFVFVHFNNINIMKIDKFEIACYIGILINIAMLLTIFYIGYSQQ